jgi:heat shock protein HtpX
MKQLWNSFKTVLLLGGLTGMFLLIGSAIGGQTGMIMAFLLAVFMNMGAWWFSDKLALRMNGAREVSHAEAPALHQMVEQLALRAQLPKPRVYIIESDMPNAFATGRSPSKGAVAVTTGIMQMLDRNELAGVIAHELAHIKNRDTLIASVAATVAGAIALLADIVMWGFIFSGFGSSDEEEGGGIGEIVGGFLTLMLAPIGALLIQMAISRSREYSADATGAEILGDPLPLASALEKLERGVIMQPTTVSPAASHLFIVNPVLGGIDSLFRTHPKTEKRVAALRMMAQQMLTARSVALAQ